MPCAGTRKSENVAQDACSSSIREIRIRPRLRHCKCCPCDALRQPRSQVSGVVVRLGVPGLLLPRAKARFIHSISGQFMYTWSWSVTWSVTASLLLDVGLLGASSCTWRCCRARPGRGVCRCARSGGSHKHESNLNGGPERHFGASLWTGRCVRGSLPVLVLAGGDGRETECTSTKSSMPARFFSRIFCQEVTCETPATGVS
jgi:hypothetical protein